MNAPSFRRQAPLALALAIVASPIVLAGCEAIGLKAHIVSTTTANGKTTTKHREAKNWDEFSTAMGEVGTDVSSFAKDVGATTAKLVKTLVDVPPPGKVTLATLDPSLEKYEGHPKFDYLKDAASKPDAPYDFTYVQIGMKEYDDFFKASAEMYGCAYQMAETARHVRLATGVITGDKQDPNAKVDDELDKANKVESSPDNAEMEAYVKEVGAVWTTVAKLGVQLVGKTANLVKTGVSLVASAPKQIMNPKLVLHIKLIVKGLDQSVGLVKDTGRLLGNLV
jgi:hypothetical protein